MSPIELSWTAKNEVARCKNILNKITKFLVGKYFVPPRKNRISDRQTNGLEVIKSNSREVFLILQHSFIKYFYESVEKEHKRETYHNGTSRHVINSLS